MEQEIKKIDSTTHFGRAEKYIKFSAKFTEFLRQNKYSKKEILSVDIDKIQKDYSLKGFVFGNYVSQEERYFFLFKIEKQLEFLTSISNNKNLGKNVLKIGFGADGKKGSLAHYNPRHQYINLNKGGGLPKGILQGETSFVHEYGHFLDFQQGQNDSQIPFNFASEYFANNPKDKQTKIFTDFTRIATSNEKYMKGIINDPMSQYLILPYEIFARLFEATIYAMAKKDLFYKRFFDDKNFRSHWYLPQSEIEKSNAEVLVKKILALK